MNGFDSTCLGLSQIHDSFDQSHAHPRQQIHGQACSWTEFRYIRFTTRENQFPKRTGFRPGAVLFGILDNGSFELLDRFCADDQKRSFGGGEEPDLSVLVSVAGIHNTRQVMDRQMNETYDAVVVGLGAVGSFALRSLARRSGGKQLKNILGIERFQRCHDRGSSHGSSRIYRCAIFEHPSYAPWALYSKQEFLSLGDGVLEQCGNLVIEETPDKDASHSMVNNCKAAADANGIDYELLSTADLRERFPQFRVVSETTRGFLEKGAGFVRPEKAIGLALAEAEANGAVVWEDTVIESITEVKDHVVLRVIRCGEQIEVVAKQVIVGAGAWTSKLIPSWKAVLTPTRQIQVFLSGTDVQHHPSNMPTWMMISSDLALPAYGFPTDPSTPGRTDQIKLAYHCRDDPIDPDELTKTTTNDEMTEMNGLVSGALSGKDLKIAGMVPCMYTMSPDGDFIIGRPAGHERIAAAAGLSGHGFKMTPAIGQMLVDLALQTENDVTPDAQNKTNNDFSNWNADFVSPSRFGV